MTWFDGVDGWTRVCPLVCLEVERGVAALVEDEQVALVRTADGSVHAVSHHDPVSGANVMARGLIGSATVAGREVATLISPMYKESYDLATGRGVSNPAVSLRTWDVRIEEGWVEVRSRRDEMEAG